jgi:hypothetical protein
MDIRQQYDDLLPKLKKTLAHIDQELHQEFEDGFGIETDLKTLNSAIRKCKDKECKTITEFSDLIRGRLYFPRPFTYQDVARRLIALFPHHISKVEWKKNYEHGLSYHGIMHMDIKFDNITFELQVMPLVFRPFMEPQHKIYEILRNDPDIDQKSKDQLRDLHNRIFDFLEDQIKDLM